jgi:predicted phosphodiesterase
VISDLHANLPALQTFLAAVEDEGCDLFYHLGDSIVIGPHPRECVELLLATPRIRLIRGNHETYFLDGIPEPRPTWLTEGEALHQTWVREQLGPEFREALITWPWIMDEEFEGVKVRFQHYALDTLGVDFAPSLRDPAADELVTYFGTPRVQLLFYGHTHCFADQRAGTRLINPGSLGCQKEALVPFTIVEIDRGKFRVEHRVVPYNDRIVYRDFERRQVPERNVLYGAFFGGRYPPRQSITAGHLVG